MGFFSFTTGDPEGSFSIPNNHTPQHSQMPTVHMILPDGTIFTEPSYDGYGEFGGQDFYTHVSLLNGGDGCRDEGIHLVYKGKKQGRTLILPRFSVHEGADYAILTDPKDCEHQGFFYSDATLPKYEKD